MRKKKIKDESIPKESIRLQKKFRTKGSAPWFGGNCHKLAPLVLAPFPKITCDGNTVHRDRLFKLLETSLESSMHTSVALLRRFH
jgi:hypothetical protein